MASIASKFRKLLIQRRDDSSNQKFETEDFIVLRSVSGDEKIIDFRKRFKKCRTCGWDRGETLLPYKSSAESFKLLPKPTYKEIYQSADSSAKLSCPSCTLLRDCIDSFDPQHVAKTPLIISFDHLIIIKPLEIFALPGSEYRPFGTYVRGIPSGDTSSLEALEWARHRMSLCSKDHGLCGNGHNAKFPDRVIDVGLSGSDEVRLVELYEHLLSGRYVALSHSWGGIVPECRTTRSTLDVRKFGINLNSLPKTFHDAVIFTRMLGIRYLWIDSICIIQDDRHDWSIQAAKMRDVYSNSFLTLAAANSANCESGLFAVLSDEFKPRKLCSLSRGSRHCQLYGRRPFEFCHWWQYTTFGAKNPPLFERAWTYQERLLSPRILWFTPWELQWECMEAVGCECSTSEDFFDKEKTPLPIFTKDYWAFPKIRLAKWLETPSNPHQEWARIVGEYCYLQMTKESDKLPAISGIAARIGSSRPSAEYLAGLWADTLARDILWHTINSQPAKAMDHLPPPKSYRAPSWSWAAVEGPLRFASTFEEINVLVCIHQCTCEYMNQNPLSEVLSGQLRVSGSVFTCQVDFLNLVSDAIWCLRPRSRRDGLVWDLFPDYDWAGEHPLIGKIQRNTEVHILQWAEDKHWVYSLVLKRQEGSESNFQRIGLVQYNHAQVKEAGSKEKFEAESFDSSEHTQITIV